MLIVSRGSWGVCVCVCVCVCVWVGAWVPVCARVCVCVCVCGLTAGQVRVGLKPCALCQGCTGAFFRIDELPAFLIKPSVTSQQNKKPNTKKKEKKRAS